jgi:hypothetical protein
VRALREERTRLAFAVSMVRPLREAAHGFLSSSSSQHSSNVARARLRVSYLLVTVNYPNFTVNYPFVTVNYPLVTVTWTEIGYKLHAIG